MTGSHSHSVSGQWTVNTGGRHSWGLTGLAGQRHSEQRGLGGQSLNGGLKEHHEKGEIEVISCEKGIISTISGEENRRKTSVKGRRAK